MSDIYTAIDKILGRLQAKYGEPIGSGLSRIVFDTGKYVIKVPRDESCFNANYNEEFRGRRKLKNEIYTVCRIWHIDKVPILWMEKVEILEKIDYDNLPDWIAFIDCGQVGYNKYGELVAYDYGDF